MKRITCLFLALVALCGTTTANTPYLAPLGKFVAQSTHIFVGTVRSIYYVDGAGRYITPQKAQRQLPYTLVCSVEVREVLFPYNLRPDPDGLTIVQIRPPDRLARTGLTVRELQYQLGSTAQRLLRKTAIFLTRYETGNGQFPRLVSADASHYHANVPLEYKKVIKELIRQQHQSQQSRR